MGRQRRWRWSAVIKAAAAPPPRGASGRSAESTVAARRELETGRGPGAEPAGRGQPDGRRAGRQRRGEAPGYKFLRRTACMEPPPAPARQNGQIMRTARRRAASAAMASPPARHRRSGSRLRVATLARLHRAQGPGHGRDRAPGARAAARSRAAGLGRADGGVSNVCVYYVARRVSRAAALHKIASRRRRGRRPANQQSVSYGVAAAPSNALRRLDASQNS